MIKKILLRMIDLYVSPLKWKNKVALQAKNIFVDNLEHYYSFFDIASRLPVNENGIIVDVGAFNGATTIIFSKQFPGRKVIGFEPHPSSFEVALKKCAPYPDITLFPYALDNEKGEKDFYVSDNGLSSSLNSSLENISFRVNGKIKVKVSTLDDMLASEGKILFIKLDTQGRELNILKGAETLKKTKFILTEMNNHQIYDNACQYYEVDEFLRKQNFKLYNLTSGFNYNGITEYDALYKNMSAD